MPKALSTVGQGSTSYIAVPIWSTASASEATGGWYIRLVFSVPSLAAINHLVGAQSSTAGSLRTLTDGALRFRNASADLITSPANAVVVDQKHTLILRRRFIVPDVIELLLDGNIIGTTGTLTSGWLTAVNQLGRFSSSSRSDITVYEFELYNGASSYQANWDETGASGSGTTWADDTATRNLTITNASGATDSWWLDYSVGGTNTIDITATYPIYTNSITATNEKPVKTVNVSAEYASYTAVVNATAVASGFNVNIVATYPAFTASVVADNIKPVKTVTIVANYPIYTGTVTATNIKPIKTVNITGTYPSYTASVVATMQGTGYSATVNTTYPIYIGSVVSTNIKPIKTVNISASYPVYNATVNNTNTKPIKTVNVTTTYSSYSVSVTATVNKINSFSINTTYPKYTANVICGSVGTDKLISINATYPKHIGSVVIGEFLSLPYRGGKGAHLVISLGSREVVFKDKSRNVKWRVENARL